MNSTIGKKITNEEANALVSIKESAFAGDNIIFTDKGYNTIKNLSENDLVMSNDNTFVKVIKKECIKDAQTLIVHGMGIDYVKCTPNQQFLVRELEKHLCSKSHSMNERPSGMRVFSEPKYICAKNLTNKHYMGMKIFSSDDDNVFKTENVDFWWLCGTYVGDGCIDLKQRRVVITGNDNDMKRLEPALSRLGYDYKIFKQQGRECYNVTIKDRSFCEFVDEIFGHYSYMKNIPYRVITLPKKQLKAFYTGFLESDGCTLSTNNNISQFTTVNRYLNSATSIIINKLFKRPTRLYFQKRSKKYVIEGRVVNQRDTYQLRFLKEKQKFEHAFIENGYIWFPFSKLEMGDIEDVYNIELDSDNGFIIGNCITR